MSGAEYYGFDVLFAKPIPLLKKRVHSVTCKAAITGPRSWYGTDGHHTRHCSGVTFTFKQEFEPSESTIGIIRGQFHEFIFSLPKRNEMLQESLQFFR